MNTRNDYYIFVSRRGEHPERWRREIRRKSKPMGVYHADVHAGTIRLRSGNPFDTDQ